MSQTQKEKSSQKTSQESEQTEAKKLEADTDIDDLLESIDEVLEAHTESEAEEFVRSFQQKGGELVTVSNDSLWNCPDCGKVISKPTQRGPHLSGCRRSKNAKYKYLNGDSKHPYEFKTCGTCGVKGWIQTRRDYCSYSCSKMGDLNPSKQRATDHRLTPTEYASAHKAVRKARGKAFGCSDCGTAVDRMYHWANLTGNYFDINDYKSLCVPCHDSFDRYR